MYALSRHNNGDARVDKKQVIWIAFRKDIVKFSIERGSLLKENPISGANENKGKMKYRSSANFLLNTEMERVFVLKKIRIANFKKFEDVELQPEKFTILMGENGCGKTSILQAVALGLRILNTTDLIQL